ncbi:unnamed protein product [Adineta ricciae]|uniref:Golgi SNAP receptor complex member 1 n=1 Tax=Adineta ricciae TaxID=249248 RepID=A0A814ACX3_ADIRI|nr:unnamed protein product [Adineta ricciae]
MASAPGTDWEDLRKQARQLENEIDAKLMSFSKLCSNYVARDHSSLLPSSPSASSFETMSMEIEKLLERLADINKRMTDAVPALLGPNTAATHTLQRHHEICQDYRREFERTKANIRTFQTREDLLVNSNTSTSDISSQGLNSRRHEHYLREMEHLNNSHNLIDKQLESMVMLKDNLFGQRKHFMNITHKVKSMANRFPLMNNILHKIKLKKQKFIIDTRLSFVDQYKLFDLLKKLLPNEDNQLTCQGFLSWLVWRVDQYKDQQHDERDIHTNKRLFDQTIRDQNDDLFHKQLRMSRTHSVSESCNDTSLAHYTQQQLEHDGNKSSDIHQQIDRLQSIVLRLASNIDTLNQKSNIRDRPPSFFETHIKHEHIEDNEPSELEMDDEHEDEVLDTNQHLDYPASTSTNLPYAIHPMSTKTIMYNGRNMMKHLRPRTTLTSFARHVASDLFSREEIMAKLHVDHNNERDVLLRHCICTAWNLSEQELYLMWPKIRNALLQLRRDAIAGKCIRMDGKRKSHEHQHQHKSDNFHHYHSDDDDDDTPIKSDPCT